ncbi:hypothetical protein BABINDRAFT_25368, partial [Babjeviella inositovora NRRL Y-12698]
LEECPLCSDESQKIRINWIQCNICDQWYHNHCVHLTALEGDSISEYHCSKCFDANGPSVYKRKSKRQRVQIDYVALNEGNGNVLALDKFNHPHILKLLSFTGTDAVVTLHGKTFTSDYAMVTGLPTPVYIPRAKRDGLGLEVPTTLTVTEVVGFIGEDAPIEVMDVLTQNGCPNWTAGMWRDYFNSPSEDRDRIRNVISLEISQFPELSSRVQRPHYVQTQDLVDRVWDLTSPDEVLFKERPQVTMYCLMSVAKSFTDFHVDFGGSSVYYTVIKGQKTFLMYPPSTTNLKAYETWCLRGDQNQVWLGDFVTGGIRVDLYEGDAFIIPSGWIHAVYTPVDTVVIGGNFLTIFNIPQQVKLARIEQATKVPRKFTFPRFQTLLWLTA